MICSSHKTGRRFQTLANITEHCKQIMRVGIQFKHRPAFRDRHQRHDMANTCKEKRNEIRTQCCRQGLATPMRDRIFRSALMAQRRCRFLHELLSRLIAVAISLETRPRHGRKEGRHMPKRSSKTDKLGTASGREIEAIRRNGKNTLSFKGVAAYADRNDATRALTSLVVLLVPIVAARPSLQSISLVLQEMSSSGSGSAEYGSMYSSSDGTRR